MSEVDEEKEHAMTATTTRPHSGVIDIPLAAEQVLAEARAAKAGRAGRTLTPGAGVPLKQALLALTEGEVLADHESPGDATLHLLSGSIRLTAGDRTIELDAGGYTAIPPVRHGVESLSDAVMLITVAGHR
jgi:quercetin dioxygenase-like cupin family protein